MQTAPLSSASGVRAAGLRTDDDVSAAVQAQTGRGVVLG